MNLRIVTFHSMNREPGVKTALQSQDRQITLYLIEINDK